MRGGFLSDLNSATSLVESLSKGSGPGLTEVSCYSYFLKSCLERCAFFCKVEVQAQDASKPKKKGVKQTDQPVEASGRAAALLMFSRLQRADATNAGVDMMSLNPLFKYRWLLNTKMQHQLQTWKDASCQSVALNMLSVRALTNHATTPQSAPQPAIVSSGSGAPPPSLPVSAAEMLLSPTKPEAAPVSKKLSVSEPPLLRFFGAPKAPALAGADID